MPSTCGKISIKLKKPTNDTTQQLKPKVSLKLKNDISLSPKKINETSIKVSYVFLEEGEFLYEANTCKLFTVSKPHRHIGYICQDTLKFKPIVVCT